MPQHVQRPRLARTMLEARVGLIEAGGGYGKSVLAAEVRNALATPSAVAVLERDTDEPSQLIGAIRRGLRAAGLSDSAAALGPAEPADVVAALELTSDPVLLVVEEAQRAGGEAAELLAAIARELESQTGLMIVGRRLHEPVRRLPEEIGARLLDAEELSFDEGEIAAVLAAALDGPVDELQAAEVARLTSGWPAAVTLVAARMARVPDVPHHALAAGGLLSELLEDLLGDLDPESRGRISRLAHLPVISDGIATACAGDGALALLTDSGLPLRESSPGWFELADPVRDELAGREPLPAEAARAAATAYAESGALATGLALLADDGEGLAGILASRPWQDLEPLALAELTAILSTVPDEAIAAEPFALVQVARLAEQEADLELTSELLARAVELAPEGPVRREADAELVAAQAMVAPGDDVEERAEAILASAGGDEPRARARALSCLGRIEAWRGEPASMLRAERHLTESAALCRLAGETEWEARTLTALGYRVEFERGDLEQAVGHMGDALGLLPGSGTERAAAATFLAEALGYVGRLDDAEAAISEAAAIGRKLGDHRVQAYAAWTGAGLASLRGDGASTVQRIRTVERHPGDWFEHPTGIEFLADAALALARTGAADAAAEYAERARVRAEAAGYPEIGWGPVGAVEARWGDPDAAEEALKAFAASPQQAPRDEWRTLLFRALAASRRQDGSGEAASLAAQAFEAAAELGRPDLPRAHEPDVAAIVEPIAVAAGSRAAAEASGEGGTFAVTLLGDFRIASAGSPVDVPAGRPSTLVKLLALAPGPIPAEEAIEVLWPGIDEGTGRQRLRNLLNRLRSSCGELVAREGGSLALGPAEVDAAGFERAALAALEADAPARGGLARTALARYAGDLLPDDRYETWATEPRERLRRRYLDLLDMLTDEAVERGDVDEAIRLLDQAQDAEPLDEDRYLRAAELLLFQGRRGSARKLVDRAANVRSQLGLEESARLARLRAATAG